MNYTNNNPKRLSVGDKIAIIALGKTVSLDEIKQAAATYQSWGLEVVLGKSIGAKDRYFAGSDELRTNDFQSFLNDSTVKAIVFARGGYGAVRIVDQIDFSPLQKHPKWLIGFSDVTVIHNHLNNFSIPTVHGTMPIFFESATPNSIQSNKEAVFNASVDYNFTSSDYCKDGECIGEIVGGNLSIIYSLLGSNSQIETKNKILFIEDLGEHLYHIDRMLQNIARNGLLSRLKGIIIGSFTNLQLGNPVFCDSVEDIFKEYFEKLNIPIFSGFPCGHIDDNHSLIFGQKTKMKVLNQKITLHTVN